MIDSGAATRVVALYWFGEHTAELNILSVQDTPNLRTVTGKNIKVNGYRLPMDHLQEQRWTADHDTLLHMRCTRPHTQCFTFVGARFPSPRVIHPP